MKQSRKMIDDQDDSDDSPVVQIKTQAKDAPPPATTAAPSVFLLSKTANKVAVDTLTITAGIPVPDGRKRVGSKYESLWNRMKPGDSVEMPHNMAHGMMSFINSKKLKAVLRKWTATTSRVWRVA